MKRNDKKYRSVNKYNDLLIEMRYKGNPWGDWIFKASHKANDHYTYVPELGVFRSNVSYS